MGEVAVVDADFKGSSVFNRCNDRVVCFGAKTVDAPKRAIADFAFGASEHPVGVLCEEDDVALG